MKDLSKFLYELPRREGARAIYIEPPMIALVLVTGVHGDDSGVRAHVELVHTPGMRDGDFESWEISSIWDSFSNSQDHWHAIYVNWSLYFGADHLQTGLELAVQAAAKGTTVELRDMRQALEKLRQHPLNENEKRLT
ncbi:MAG TPA: hypothetical protein VE779_00800 [Candidatus Angelobacter sp.]|nr:hypothetical protein [Candidatus Angelobacter sp.]